MNRALSALPLLALAVPCLALPVLDVDLRPDVALPRADVRLGDVADVAGADAAQLERLRRLPLGSLPAGGAVLTRHDIERRLKAHAAWAGVQVRWSGSAATRLSAVADDGTAARGAVPLARDALLAWLGQWSDRPEAVAVVDAEAAAPLPAGPLELRVRSIAEAQPAARMRVWVDVWQAGRFVRALPLRFDVRAPGPALLARRALPAGSRVTEADVEPGEVDLAALARPLPKAALPSQVERGLRLRRALAPGMAIDGANSEAAPPVCGGDTVRLSLTAGRVVLASQARALQDGQLGQRVAVRTAGSPQPIMARVTGAGTVEVE